MSGRLTEEETANIQEHLPETLDSKFQVQRQTVKSMSTDSSLTSFKYSFESRYHCSCRERFVETTKFFSKSSKTTHKNQFKFEKTKPRRSIMPT